MNLVCPNNHTSTDAEFCSECGIQMSQAAPGAPASVASAPDVSPAPGAASRTLDPCPDCGTERDDATADFCGVCGHNFKTGASGEVPTLQPVAGTAAAPAAPAPATTSGPRMELVVTVDPAVSPEESAAAPTDRPPLTFTLFDEESLLGRVSPTVHPTVPIDDEGVSRRHCLILRQPDGSYLVRDLGSTNGTRLNGTALMAGADSSPLREGDTLELGCWTRITIQSIRP